MFILVSVARLSLYLVRQMLPWLALGLAGALLLFLATQLVRVAPVFVGAGAGALELAFALGLLLVPVGAWALAPAAMIAVFAVAGRMSAHGETTALDAAGIPRWRLWSGPAALSLLLAAACAWLALSGAPRAQAALRDLAGDLAGRALVGRLEPGRFVEPVPGITFFADTAGDGRFGGVLIEDARDARRPSRIVARQAAARYDEGERAMEVEILDGHAFLEAEGGGAPTAIGFGRMSMAVPLEGEIARRLGFLPRLMAVPTGRLLGPPPPGASPGEWGFALWRRVAGPVGFASLTLASLVLAFGAQWRRRGLAVGAAGGLFLAYHLLLRLGETLAVSGVLHPAPAALIPSAAAICGAIAGLALSRQRRPSPA